MFRKKSITGPENIPKSAFNGCPNTVLSNNLEGNLPILTFSCPRVPRIIGKGGLGQNSIEERSRYARNVILSTMGSMCVNCTFSDLHYSPNIEASISPNGAIIENVVWTPIQVGEKPTSNQNLTIQ